MESKDSHLILHVGEGVASSSDSYSLEKRREVRNPQPSRKTRALSYLKLWKHSQIWALEKTCSKNMWVPQEARGPPPSSALASKMASLGPFPENKFSLYILLFKQKYGESEFIAIFFPQFSLEPRFDPRSQLKHHILDESSPYPASLAANTWPGSVQAVIKCLLNE